MQSGLENATSMEHTMIYSERETPFHDGTGMIMSRAGRFVSQLAWIGVTTLRIGNVAGPRVADGPGISVPNGRRLRN